MKLGFLQLATYQLIKNLGFRYVAFRTYYEIFRRSGLLRLRFPKCYPSPVSLSLDQWRKQPFSFFTPKLNQLHLNLHDLTHLKARVSAIQEDSYWFFSGEWITMCDWHTHPKTGYVFDSSLHWTRISDFSAKTGDIKYVWEKSRFCFLYDLVRYDFHSGEDQSALVLSRIANWIDDNPVNCGVNWRCGQEIALRVLNWIFALNYYRFSPNLTQPVFDKIILSIYCQIRRIHGNMQFSRMALRNNHTLTEALAIYTVGLLFPCFQESLAWKSAGKRWFESEISKQILADGTYIQYSMNYHRVVVQLMSWALRLGEINHDHLGEEVYAKARKSLGFLLACQDKETGWLPNTGNNDGALFFPLTECDFRNFRPQLGALAGLLKMEVDYAPGKWEEESCWLGIDPAVSISSEKAGSQLRAYPQGGYYVARDRDTLTFLRCSAYRNRPFQADNLHLDIWVNGKNILRDAGTYSYNTDPHFQTYFAGTASHNTVMPGDLDQMQKGCRFTWAHWVTQATGHIWQSGSGIGFYGFFTGYRFLKTGIEHARHVHKCEGELCWIVEDWLRNVPAGMPLQQIWHPCEDFLEEYLIKSEDDLGNEIHFETMTGWYSETYGKKVPCTRLVFTTTRRYLKTEIRKRDS